MTIVRWFSYTLAAFLLLTAPFRLRFILRKAGHCLLPLTRKNEPLYFVVMAIAVITLFILRKKNFEPYVLIILYATALLGIELAIRDSIYRRIAGVYEQMLIVDGRAILKKNIEALPTLEYETDPSNSLKIIIKSGVILAGFENSVERSAAAGIIKNWC